MLEMLGSPSQAATLGSPANAESRAARRDAKIKSLELAILRSQQASLEAFLDLERDWLVAEAESADEDLRRSETEARAMRERLEVADESNVNLRESVAKWKSDCDRLLRDLEQTRVELRSALPLPDPVRPSPPQQFLGAEEFEDEQFDNRDEAPLSPTALSFRDPEMPASPPRDVTRDFYARSVASMPRGRLSETVASSVARSAAVELSQTRPSWLPDESAVTVRSPLSALAKPAFTLPNTGAQLSRLVKSPPGSPMGLRSSAW